MLNEKLTVRNSQFVFNLNNFLSLKRQIGKNLSIF